MSNTAAAETGHGGSDAQASEAMLRLIAGAGRGEGPSSAFQGAVVLVNQISAPQFASLRNALVHGEGPVHLTAGESSIVIEGEFLDAVRAIVMAVDAGHTAAVVDPVRVAEDRELTSQQAADLLNVSRPHVVQLAKSGRLPHRMVGNRHRFRLADVLMYEDEARQTRADALAAMVPAEGYDEDDF